MHLHVSSLLAILQVVLSASSEKKGVAFHQPTFTCGDFDILDNVNWFYNWGTNADMGCDRDELGFVPMIWGYWGQSPEIKEDVILGFNEPNHPDQSNLTPRRAAEAWVKLQDLYEGKTLVAPSPSPGGNISPEQWFDEFFVICEELGGCRVDYIAYHSYTGNVNGDVGHLNNLYNRYNKKVWFTEFAVPNTEEESDVLAYMTAMLPKLEELESVHRYSWYMAKWHSDQQKIQVPGNGSSKWFLSSVNSLFYPGTSQLTPVGEFYNQF